MKKFLLGSVAVLSITSANAADISAYKAQAMPVLETYSWTGLYLGLDAGGAFGNKTASFNPDPVTAKALAAVGQPANVASNAAGMFAGGHLGYDYQINSFFVVGVEASLVATGINSGTNGTVIANLGSFTSSEPWRGAVVGRAGLVLDPRLMIYGLGGLAFGEVNDAASAVGFVPVTASSMKSGWTGGLGMEYMFSKHFYGGLEYRHTDLGLHGPGVLVSTNPRNTATLGPTIGGASDEARAKVGYRF